ncbi:MAG: putative RNA uridine N3 methyltransferase [Pyrobaculum sp.]
MFSIAVPHDFLLEAPDEPSKIRKLGYLARAAAIFKVDTIIIYHYGAPLREEIDLAKTVLEYLATPPYLRKKVFKQDRRLRYAGLLPPLKIPSHTAPPEPQVGEVREGVVERWDGYYSLVYIGAGKYAKVPKPYPIGTRLLVKMEAPTARPDTYRASVYKGPPPTYWGYRVEVRPLKMLAEGFDTVVLTGKEGESICRVKPALGKRTLVVFGGPKKGVDEIYKEAGLDPPGRLINFAPGQGVETIRTEEAVFIVLSLLNYVAACGVCKRQGDGGPGAAVHQF